MNLELLNLGCGNRLHSDWTNVDFHSTGPQVIRHDLSTGLPFNAESFQVVYLSHLLEHFSKSYAPVFLSQCHQVLKPGGIIRIAVPDLEKIIRIYLEMLDKSIDGDATAQKNYEWIMLELFDQMIRNEPGGEMLKYWKQKPMPAESFVIERQGAEVLSFINTFRNNSSQTDSDMDTYYTPKDIGEFRQSGEVHQWMYDRYSLRKLLYESGFSDIKVCAADESTIPDFNTYRLDIDAKGAIRKPDSLFMEAVKKMDKGKHERQSNLLKVYGNSSDNLLRVIADDIIPSEACAPKTRLQKKSLSVVHLCMQDFGGAGKAAYRLHKGLQSIGLNSTMLVLNKNSGDPSVKVLPAASSNAMTPCMEVSAYHSPEWKAQVERWQQLASAHPNRPAGFEMFTDAESSLRLDLIEEIKEADIINLHWVAGVIDYANAVLALKNKPLVWTLHDMNPFTGGCHYAGDCQKYKTSCHTCFQLGSDTANDLAQHVWTQKKYTIQKLNFQIVAPSRWLGRCAEGSALFSRSPVHIIPYGFPLDTFKPYPQAQVRRATDIPETAKVILFGADSVTNHRKGFLHLLRALNQIPLKGGHQYVLMTFGSIPPGVKIPSKYRVLNAGKIADETQLARLYSAADLFVLPSLEDNLPNTVVEAMACGLPVVGFDIGGVPDMVTHEETGYLAKPKDIEGLINGINWVISSSQNGVDFGQRCRQRAEQKYAFDIQAYEYQKLYNRLLSKAASVDP